jgi:hypothetical protein
MKRLSPHTRRAVIAVVLSLLVVLGLASAVVATGGGSTVTRARLERSLPLAFSRLYVDQAHLLGRHDVSVASMHAQAMCDKHGPDVADVGPGGDWVCLMSWQDPDVPMPPEGYGKFELNVHSNDCFTAGGPTKLTGYLTLTDKSGREVTNPVFEFDGCFDPGSDDSATGVFFPSLVGVTSTAISPDQNGRVSVQLGCGTGAKGCAGHVVAMAGSTRLGSAPYAMKEESTAKLSFPTALPKGATEVIFTVQPKTGVGPSGPATVAVQ